MAPPSRKRRPALVFFTALLIIALYFLLFPLSLGREIVARPAWAVAVPAASAAGGSAEGSAAPFRLGNRFGYVRGDGTVQYVGGTTYGVSLSESGFVSYTQLATDWILQDTAGNRRLSFSGSGYPLLSPSGDRIFNVKSDLSGIIELDANGEQMWSRDFPSLMTCLSLRGDFLLTGLLDGSLLLLNRSGYPILENSPGGCRIPVIVGAAVSPDGASAACISGIDPQSLTVFGRQGSAYQVLHRETLSSDFRREARMEFSPDGRFLVYETERGVGLFVPSQNRSRRVALDGALSGVAYPGNGRYAALCAQSGNLSRLLVMSPLGSPLCSERLTGAAVWIGGIDGQLLIGMDGRLLRVDVEAL